MAVDPRDTSIQRFTVGELVDVLKQWPAHYRVDFTPGDEIDTTNRAVVESLEGDTSDGPGTIWIRLGEAD